MANLKQTKRCRECNELKEITKFSKRAASTDGLQQKCKSCNSKDNLQFRIEKPEHHADWQKNNAEQHIRNVMRYRKADKPSKIYSISNENGEYYIGMTNTHLSVRMFEHKTHYRRRHGDIPGLHKSFDTFGFDNHKVNVLLELEGIDRTQLRFIEKAFIQSFHQQGKSLNKLI
jgi:hypothetical protein